MFNPSALIGILFQTHYACTISNPPAFTFKTKISADKIDQEKLKNAMENKENMNKFVELCINKFKTKYPNALYGSVQYNPTVWTEIALKTIKNNNNKYLIFPNGCCTIDNCPINNFYLIVAEELMEFNIIV